MDWQRLVLLLRLQQILRLLVHEVIHFLDSEVLYYTPYSLSALVNLLNLLLTYANDLLGRHGHLLVVCDYVASVRVQ